MITDSEFIENLNKELGDKTFDRNNVYCVFEPYDRAKKMKINLMTTDEFRDYISVM